MTHEPSSGREPGAGRLWTDPREEDEHQHWLRPRTQPPAPPQDEQPAPDPGDRRGPRLLPVVLGTLAAALLFGVGLIGGQLLGGDEPSQPAALPAIPGAAPADQRAKAVRAIYASASPSVVRIQVSEGSAEATGTGFVIDSGGTIVTNAHVVGSASSAQVRLDDNAQAIDARILGTDPSSDLAVLRVDGSKTAHLRPLALADSDDVQVGDVAVAIGYPLGLDRTLTQGVVSGVGRAIKAPNGFSIDKVIQTDAAINPGNSGGPLLNSAGRVIGVNSQIATAGGGGNVGIGFAVPSNMVSRIVPRLERGVTIRRPYLGVTTQPSIIGSGASVIDLAPGGPAQQAGVQKDDVIVSVAGDEILAPDDISTAIEGHKPGDDVAIEVQRAGATRTLRVKLGTQPASVGTP